VRSVSILGRCRCQDLCRNVTIDCTHSVYHIEGETFAELPLPSQAILRRLATSPPTWRDSRSSGSAADGMQPHGGLMFGVPVHVSFWQYWPKSINYAFSYVSSQVSCNHIRDCVAFPSSTLWYVVRHLKSSHAWTYITFQLPLLHFLITIRFFLPPLVSTTSSSPSLTSCLLIHHHEAHNRSPSHVLGVCHGNSGYRAPRY
jgi:hypothetical protein